MEQVSYVGLQGDQAKTHVRVFFFFTTTTTTIIIIIIIIM